jgi:hypothetical protein
MILSPRAMCVFKGDEHGLVSDIVESNIIGVTDE